MDDDLTPSENLMVEVLIARHRCGEQVWSFQSSQRPQARSLEAKGVVGWKSGIVPNSILVWLTDDAKARFVNAVAYSPPVVEQLQELLGAIWLYIPWRYVTKQLTTDQKEMFADAIDATSEFGPVAERWWQS